MAEEQTTVPAQTTKRRGQLQHFNAHHPPAQELLSDCVHCGFCLINCPTYRLWGQEADSPRGRIYLMQLGVDGETAMNANYVSHFDRCLGCMACLTSCPSGVQYDKLIEATRAQDRRRFQRPLSTRVFRRLIFTVFPHRPAANFCFPPLALSTEWIAIFAAPLEGPEETARAMADNGKACSPRSVTWRTIFPRRGLPASPATPRLKVGMLLGCVRECVFRRRESGHDERLAAEGCEIVNPPRQGCCSALMTHAGEEAMAKDFARKTIDAFENAAVDVIAINAAGCGSAMKEYGHLLRDDPQYASRAAALANQCRDVSEVLADLEPIAARHPLPMRRWRITTPVICSMLSGLPHNHDGCSKQFPVYKFWSSRDPATCCGSAGIYNLVQPQAAEKYRKTKSEKRSKNQRRGGGIPGNPGCTLQIRGSLKALDRSMPVLHWIQLLDASIRSVPLKSD